MGPFYRIYVLLDYYSSTYDDYGYSRPSVIGLGIFGKYILGVWMRSPIV